MAILAVVVVMLEEIELERTANKEALVATRTVRRFTSNVLKDSSRRYIEKICSRVYVMALLKFLQF